MDLQDINSSISYLEKGDTTFENCQKLASLYIIREHYLKGQNSDGNGVVSEYKDILPQYCNYLKLKKKYQTGELDKKVVQLAIQKVCKEINEFILTLYQCTDMPEERDCILQMIENLQKTGK